MHETVVAMIAKYQCQSEQEYINALKEIFQEIALLGLWRAKFFEQAAFYGGSALRILYSLDRFSEDLDFSLLSPQAEFSLESYNQAIVSELASFGFDVSVETKVKSQASQIESAFIKTNTQTQLLAIDLPEKFSTNIHRMRVMKIKMEVDTNPPGNFNAESKMLLMPIPFSILTFSKADLFAGKIHALLCRNWQSCVKGRDWYDFVWYLARDIPLNLVHLKTRMVQSGHWNNSQSLTLAEVQKMLQARIAAIDMRQAIGDIQPFVQDSASLSLWSQEFFMTVTDKLRAQSV